MTAFLEGNRSFIFPSETFQALTFAEYSKQRLRLLSSTFDRMNKILGQDANLEQYQYVLASLCREPALEQLIVEELDTQTSRETIDALQGGKLSMDCLVVGTGPAGVSFSSKLRQLHPRALIWMADDRDFRGGQFAEEGFNFKLNTPKLGPLGFAGELPDPNNLGEAAFLQITDIADDGEDYFRRKKFATCLKVDGFIAAPALVGVKVLSVEHDSNDLYTVTAVHKETGQEVSFNSQAVVFARGRGKPKYGLDLSSVDTQETLATRGDKIFVSEAFTSYIDKISVDDVLSEIKSGIAMIGAGDSANTALEAIIDKLLTILSPPEIQQLHIDVYGAKYEDAQQFREDVRIPRYDALQPYIGNFILPHKDKAAELLTVGKRSIGIKTSTFFEAYNTIAIMTGYQNPPIENLVWVPGGARVIDVMGDKELDGEVIAQQIEGENIFTIGMDTRENFPGRPPVFARSIARYTPRILATAEIIAGLLQ